MAHYVATMTVTHDYECADSATADQEQTFWSCDPHSLVDFAGTISVTVEEV